MQTNPLSYGGTRRLSYTNNDVFNSTILSLYYLFLSFVVSKQNFERKLDVGEGRGHELYDPEKRKEPTGPHP